MFACCYTPMYVYIYYQQFGNRSLCPKDATWYQYQKAQRGYYLHPGWGAWYAALHSIWGLIFAFRAQQTHTGSSSWFVGARLTLGTSAWAGGSSRAWLLAGRARSLIALWWCERAGYVNSLFSFTKAGLGMSRKAQDNEWWTADLFASICVVDIPVETNWALTVQE